MSTARQWQVVGLIVALLGAGLVYSATLGGSAVEQVRVGARTPEFHAATLDGSARTKSIADYKGEVVLINLCATWCGPCVM